MAVQLRMDEVLPGTVTLGAFCVAASMLIGCGGEPDGAEVGTTLTNYQWRGYVNEQADGLSTDQPLSDYSIEALTQSGPRYALIHLAAVF